jgi:hypothetical protein
VQCPRVQVKFWVGELLNVEENCILAIVGTKKDLIDKGQPRAVSETVVQK